MEVILSEVGFFHKPCFLKHAYGRRVFRSYMRFERVQLHDVETKVNKSGECFRRQPLPPVIGVKRITHFGPPVLRLKIPDGACADEFVRFFGGDAVESRFIPLDVAGYFFDEGKSIVQGFGRRNGEVPENAGVRAQDENFRGIIRPHRAKDEPRGSNGRKGMQIQFSHG